jgi:hypothetical protein
MQMSFETAETIRRKKAQYCRYLDTKQWDSLEALAFPNAEMIFLDASGLVQTAGKRKFTFSTPKAFVDATRVLFKNAQTLLRKRYTRRDMETLNRYPKTRLELFGARKISC